MIFSEFFAPAFIERLGWGLLHSTWQVALIAMIFAITVRLIAAVSPRVRYTIGCVALLAMVTVPFTTILVTRPVPRDDVELTSSTTPSEEFPVAEPIPASPNASSATPFTDDNVVVVARFHRKIEAGDSRLTSSAAPGFFADIASRIGQLRNGLRIGLPVLVALWSAGVVLLLFRPMLGLIVTQRLRKVGVSPVPESVRRLADRLAKQMGIQRSVEVVHSTLASVPAAIGLVHPMILLPASIVSGLTVEELEAVIVHELAHVRRLDFLVNALQTVVEALLFFHPLAWWVSSRVRLEREYCCDDSVVKLSGNLTGYARALLAVDQLRGAPTGLVQSASGGSIPCRIRRLMGKPLPRNSPDSLLVTGVVLLVGLVVLYMAEAELPSKLFGQAGSGNMRAGQQPCETPNGENSADANKEKAKQEVVVAAFESLMIEYLPEYSHQGHRLTFAADGSFSFTVLATMSSGDKLTELHHQAGRLPVIQAKQLNELLAATQYLSAKPADVKPGDMSIGNYVLSVRRNSKTQSKQMKQWSTKGPYHALIGFSLRLAKAEYGEMPELPWARYTKRRFEDAIARDKPILLYFYDDAISHILYDYPFSNNERHVPDSLAILRRNGVVCLNAGPAFTHGVVGTNDPKSPNYIARGRDGLSLYLPKTKETIFIRKENAVGVLGAMRRAFSKNVAGPVDVGGADFTWHASAESRNIAGVDFRVYTELDWVMPEKKGERRAVPIKLGVTGRGILNDGRFFPVLVAMDGERHVLAPKPEVKRPSDASVQKGYRGIHVFAYLEKDQETGEVKFVFVDNGLKHVVRAGTVKPGKYRLSIELRAPSQEEDGANSEKPKRWSGSGSTLPVTITIHEFNDVIRPRTVDGWTP